MKSLICIIFFLTTNLTYGQTNTSCAGCPDLPGPTENIGLAEKKAQADWAKLLQIVASLQSKLKNQAQVCQKYSDHKFDTIKDVVLILAIEYKEQVSYGNKRECETCQTSDQCSLFTNEVKETLVRMTNSYQLELLLKRDFSLNDDEIKALIEKLKLYSKAARQ